MIQSQLVKLCKQELENYLVCLYAEQLKVKVLVTWKIRKLVCVGTNLRQCSQPLEKCQRGR